jgi:hypothetical protein
MNVMPLKQVVMQATGSCAARASLSNWPAIPAAGDDHGDVAKNLAGVAVIRRSP